MQPELQMDLEMSVAALEVTKDAALAAYDLKPGCFEAVSAYRPVVMGITDNPGRRTDQLLICHNDVTIFGEIQEDPEGPGFYHYGHVDALIYDPILDDSDISPGTDAQLYTPRKLDYYGHIVRVETVSPDDDCADGHRVLFDAGSITLQKYVTAYDIFSGEVKVQEGTVILEHGYENEEKTRWIPIDGLSEEMAEARVVPMIRTIKAGSAVLELMAMHDPMVEVVTDTDPMR